MTDRAEEELSEVYVRYGIAASLGQNLESLAISLLKLSARVQSPDLTDDHMEALDSDLARRPFGPLLEQIGREVGLEESDHQVLLLGLERRNYLVHRFFLKNAELMYSPSGRASCIAELRGIADTLRAAHAILDRVVNAYFKKAGWSGGELQQAKAALRGSLVGPQADLDA